MRGRLLVCAAFVVAAALTAADVRPGSAAAACTATARGAHTRGQTLHVTLSAGCPAGGTASGTLRFSQWPGIRAQAAFTLDYGQRTLRFRVPRAVSLRPAWKAHAATAGVTVTVETTPRRRVSGSGSLTISGGFTASNGAVVRWQQTLHATADRITLGSIHVTATLPGTHAVMIQVHQVRQYCDTKRGCPFDARATTETSTFPAGFTHVTVDSALWFATGNGTLLSGKEQPTIVLRSKRTGRVLGRSDFQAVIRAG